MDKLISLEPSNIVTVRIEPGQKCYGEITLHNVMHTMPVAFRLQPLSRSRYSVKPPSGIIEPLAGVTVEIIYHLPPNALLPDSFPNSDDSFLLHSVVAPGAAPAHSALAPDDWFTNRKKQVFIDSGIRVMFVGSAVLARLVATARLDDLREVLEKSEPAWKPADAVDSATGHTLLHLAISKRRADIVQLILEFEPDIEASSRSSGSTPLEAAAASGEALIAEILLANRASTERSPTSLWGPIHHAAANGHVEVVNLLLHKKVNVNALTRDGATALHLAVGERRRDCARLLLAGGARADTQNAGDGDTPLHVAAGLGDEPMVGLLLQRGATEKNIQNKFGKTAYDLAVENGHSRLFDSLRLGDDLCGAARKGEVTAIQRLLDRGANLNGRDQHGWTALHRASFKGHTDAVKSLIESAIDVNARDEDGHTALHCAVEAGQVDVTEILTKNGADVEARTNKGVTPLNIAESLHYSGITRILVQRGSHKDGFTNKFDSKLNILNNFYTQTLYEKTSKERAIVTLTRKKASRSSKC